VDIDFTILALLNGCNEVALVLFAEALLLQRQIDKFEILRFANSCFLLIRMCLHFTSYLVPVELHFVVLVLRK